MKSTYETMGGNYQQDGNYLLPDFEVPECPKVGVWGERRRKYMREHQKALYTAMQIPCAKSNQALDKAVKLIYNYLKQGEISIWQQKNTA